MQAPVGSEHPGSTSRHHLLRTNGCKTAKGIKWFCGCWRGRTARNPANCIRFLNHLRCWLMLKWRRVMSSTMTNIHKRSLELPKKKFSSCPVSIFLSPPLDGEMGEVSAHHQNIESSWGYCFQPRLEGSVISTMSFLLLSSLNLCNLLEREPRKW